MIASWQRTPWHFVIAPVFLLACANAQTGTPQFETGVRPVLASQCFQCHGDKVQTAGLNLAVFRDAAGAAEKPELWTKVREKIVDHRMPPPPLPGLNAQDYESVTRWIDSINGVPKASSGPGRVTARRLNRTEYNNTIRDFLGVTIHPGDDFPADNQGYGFDNIGDVLTLSPLLMEKYMTAARSISRVAVYGESYEKKPGIIGKLLVKSIQDDGQVSGNTLPFSIRGTLEGVYHFPVEADYVLRFRILNRRGQGPSAGRGMPLTDEEEKARLEAARTAEPPVEFDIDVDGRQVRKVVVEGNEAFAYSRGPTVAKIHVTAGDHTIHAYFPGNADLSDPRVNLTRDGRRRLGADFVEITGPYDPSPSRPESYAKIFVCASHDAVCTRKIVESMARRGFRRPPTEPEIQRLLKLVAMVQKQGDPFEEGIRIALQSVLVSPAFLFRLEQDPVNSTGAYPVNDYELASRLSYFLWSSMPDDESFKLAERHELRPRPVLEAQVKRMLQDPRADSLVDNFAMQWLELRALGRKKPDALKFPTVDDELLAAMRRETLLFVGEIFRQDRSLLDLVDAKFTYLNGPLARYYGVPGVNGVSFQRVSLDGTERGGLLTQGSILTLTSYSTRTSPVIRGKWVLENLLGSAPPPPPADVPVLEEKNLGTDASVRVRLEQHRANPACAVCHRQMDPIGFGLENFDAAGGWRTKEGRFDVDSSGTLPDGRTFEGVGGLRNILKSQSALFTRNLTEKMLTFALGRGLESSDKIAVEQINQRLTANGYKLSVLATAIVESEPFQMRRKEEVMHASR
jgi:Protein of unknown function (DUF1592)/Protein of unknown function (DUF1588)/Protein of unknown function (DUF1587)/Protein of unknown function (DUF1585)/Protein of unknown function (DUF1595)/Planctomycete cytochrome C